MPFSKSEISISWLLLKILKLKDLTSLPKSEYTLRLLVFRIELLYHLNFVLLLFYCVFIDAKPKTFTIKESLSELKRFGRNPKISIYKNEFFGSFAFKAVNLKQELSSVNI